MKNRKIRILVLGDPQVGKTSWITSLVSENQPDQVCFALTQLHQQRFDFIIEIPSVIDPVVFTEMFVHQFSVSTVLIDSSSSILNQPDLFREEVKSAQVILLLYNLAEGGTIKSMKETWMPRINKENENVPVIIIGNKRDLQDEMMSHDTIPEENRIEKVMVPMIKGFKQVQMGFECSAVLSQHISDVIYGAHIAVLFPLAPLYDISEKSITTGFQKALTRIFRICDQDNDNKWSDAELREFQYQVFQRELTNADIQGIKQLIREENTLKIQSRLERSSSADKNAQEITVDGFLTLQKKCVELMKMQISWAILRFFNYDDNLEIEKRCFKDRLVVDESVGQSVELSDKANEFLINACFLRFKTERLVPISGDSSLMSDSSSGTLKENVLLRSSIYDIFFPYPSASEDQHPFELLLSTVTLQDKDYLLQHEWLSLWATQTRANYCEVYKMLVYIGYDGQLEDTFVVTNATNSFSEIQKMANRQLFNVCIVGDQDCEGFLSKILEAYQQGTDQINVGSNRLNRNSMNSRFVDYATQIKFAENKSKIVAFTFARESSLSEMIKDPESAEEDSNQPVKKFDLIGIVYKSSAELARFLEEKMNFEKFAQIPKFFVQINPEDKEKSSGSVVQEEDGGSYRYYSKEHIRFSEISELKLSHLNKSIYQLIENPTKGLHKLFVEQIKQQDSFISQNVHYVVAGSGIICLVGLLFWANRSAISSIFQKFKNYK